MSTAPDLVLVEQFLNTLDERTFSVHGEKHIPSDLLTSVDALAGWLSEHGLDATKADLTTAVEMRTALRGNLGGDGGDLASFPLHLAPDDEGRLHLKADSGVPGLDVILETVASGVAGGGWKRLKLCASEDCRWAFYDVSRSGGGRWCDMEICGNRHKTRAYRRRLAG